MSEFTLEDNSSKPYAWILEAVDMQDVIRMGGAEQYVTAYAQGAINATNYSKQSDAELFEIWLNESGEYKAAVAYVQSRIDEYELEQVMTPAEIEEEFGLAEGTVRQAINRDSLSARKADERTWLVHRRHAEKRWENRK